jgi:hypothetical protein
MAQFATRPLQVGICLALVIAVLTREIYPDSGELTSKPPIGEKVLPAAADGASVENAA